MLNETHVYKPETPHEYDPIISEYRELLDLSLYAFNAITNQNIHDGEGTTTYTIASKIEKSFRK